MPRPMSFIAAAAALALPGGRLAAQSVDQDVQCVMASNFFVRTEKDPAKRQLAVAASFYYLGRLDSRTSPAQLRTAMLAQSKRLTPANLGQTMTGCATRLRDKALALEGMAQDLAKPNPAKPK